MRVTKWAPARCSAPTRSIRTFDGARSYLRIGNDNKIREHFTISRGTPPESATEVGDGNFIMTSGHIAHNCRIGNRTVIASCVLLGGYVEIEDGAFLSGGVLVHQFSKVGRLAMVSGNTRVNLDAPPFFTYSGFAIEPRGLNLVGLKRAGFQAAQIGVLKQAYRYLYRSGLKLEDALTRIETDIPTPETLHLAAFIRSQPPRHRPQVRGIALPISPHFGERKSPFDHRETPIPGARLRNRALNSDTYISYTVWSVVIHSTRITPVRCGSYPARSRHRKFR